MDGISPVALLFQVVAGVGLAACCGLRAFLPPLVIGLSARLGVAELILGPGFELEGSFAWMQSTPALVVFGSAVVLELLADKVPWVDHALDTVQTVVRPVSGALVFAATLTELEPLPAAVVGLLVGGSLAGGVHLAKAKTRLMSTASTGGLASPILSLIEDFVALVGSLLAILAGVVVAAILFALVVIGGRWVLRRRRLAAPASGTAPE
jgi:uncharacterized membrane protein